MNSYEKEYIQDALINNRYRTIDRIIKNINECLNDNSRLVRVQSAEWSEESERDFKLYLFIDNAQVGWINYIRDNANKFFITNVVI